MFGILNTPFGFVDPYNLAIMTGVVVSLIILIITYLKVFKKIKALLYILAYVIVILLGQYFASFIRQANDGNLDNIKFLMKNTLDKAGSHYLGQVICYGLIFYPVAIFLRQLCGEVFGIEISPKEDIKKLVSITSFVLPVQHIFSRMGCISRGCCYGINYSGPFAMRFPYNDDINVSVFPCQFLEIAFMIILIIIMIILYKKGKHVSGIMIIGFSVTFFISEFVTYNVEKYKVFGLTYIQLFTFISLIIGVIHTWKFNRKIKE